MLPPLPENEEARLNESLDDFAALAAHVCDVPTALIRLADTDRQWFQATVGTALCLAPRECSFCDAALGQNDLLIVPDAAADPRFCDDPLVTADPYIRFYAGAPLVTAKGHALGTLCVLDCRPRVLSPAQIAALRALARQVIVRLEMYRRSIEQEAKERTRQAGEALKSAILQSALDCIVTINQEGSVVEWNPAAERTFGCTEADALGRELAELIVPPSLRDAHRRGMAHYLATGEGPVLNKRIEITGQRSDGTEFPVELAITPIRLEGMTLFTATLRDISDRRGAEQQLQDQEEQYRRVFENATHGIYRTTPDGQILLANPALLAMLGYETFEQLAARDLEAEGTEAAYDRADFKARLEADGEVRGLEAAWKRRDGRKIVVRENARLVCGAGGLPLFYEGSVEDITARKEAEEALRVAHTELERRVERRTAALAEANRALTAEVAERQQVEARLASALEEQENIMETVPDVLFRLNLRGQLVQWNRKMETVTGLSPKELQGIPATELFPPADRAAIVEAITQAFSTGYAEVEGSLQGKDGTLTPHHFLGVPLRDAAGQVIGLTGMGRDVTEQRRQQAAVLESEQRYRALVDLSPEAMIVLQDDRLVYANRAGVAMLGAGSLAEIAGTPALDFVHPDYQLHARERLRQTGRLETKHHRWVRRDGRVIDVESVSGPTDHKGRPARQVLARDITDRQRAEERVLALNDALIQAYDSTIEGWSRALDYRDHETEGHSQRVTELTLRLARTVGLGEDELVHVRRGALLHDMGKMGVPDRVLLKPGPLDDAEWEVMRRHPALAVEMLAPIMFLGPALQIPLCHHEKWDGTGYPHGLKGEQIPLVARLFAVVDVWDALRSDRPYRRAWESGRVVDHIQSLSGSHFDPQVVQAFLSLMAEGGETRTLARAA